MSFVITPIYAALLGLLFVWLSLRVIGARRAAKVALGDGGDKTLLRRLRVQGNFAEYAPLGLILIACIELQGAPAWAVHAPASALLIGRCVHAYGVSGDPENFRLRVAGMMLTFAAIGIAALTNLALVIV